VNQPVQSGLLSVPRERINIGHEIAQTRYAHVGDGFAALAK